MKPVENLVRFYSEEAIFSKQVRWTQLLLMLFNMSDVTNIKNSRFHQFFISGKITKVKSEPGRSIN